LQGVSASLLYLLFKNLFVCHHVLLYVAIVFRVLQDVAECYRVLQGVAEC